MRLGKPARRSTCKGYTSGHHERLTTYWKDGATSGLTVTNSFIGINATTNWKALGCASEHGDSQVAPSRDPSGLLPGSFWSGV